jgi:hypothetical protein
MYTHYVFRPNWLSSGIQIGFTLRVFTGQLLLPVCSMRHARVRFLRFLVLEFTVVTVPQHGTWDRDGINEDVTVLLL